MLDPVDRPIAEFFDRCARAGDMAGFSPEEEEKLAGYLKDWNLHPGLRVLEPGCGSGRLTERIASFVGTHGEILALDLSPEMVTGARNRNLPPQVIVQEGSARSIPREDGWFDVILCFCVFPHFLNREACMAEMARVLKPAGDIWVNHFMRREELNAFHGNASVELIRHVLPDREKMVELFDRAGLDVLECTDDARGYRLHARKREVVLS
ncbi:MAG TPA: class I SAM-dependent methyltransferase [Thermoanaerobaculia bacterium]|nr:class I SAM-dependent methyltransferase [Thermoanaerobaculia bacterium]HUM30875.1 class I SAM-dependent methyltransferase [Thermoanaerobaculia bacterium]HXK69224.1 class I SAM-dependent methyltransferase [Thermoanaerobaculia bacterium]